MKLMAVSMVAVVLVAACSEEAEPSSSNCADISGNYAVTSTRTSGNCEASLDGDGKSTVSFARDGAGGWTVVLPGIEGGCPGTLDVSCKFLSNCELRDKAGALLATDSVEYTFSGRTFSGSAVLAAHPPIAAKSCGANYSETGSKL